MTTIVWDGKVLASDSRATVHIKNDTRKLLCLKCESDKPKVHDHVNKITLPDKQKINGVHILAMGFSGPKETIQKIINIIKLNININDVVKMYKHIRLDFPFGNVRGIIVTNEEVYLLTANIDGITCISHVKNSQHCIGSGEPYSEMDLMLFGLGSIHAVETAILMDDSTGGNINWVDCSIDILEIKTYKTGSKQKIKENIKLLIK